MVVVIRMKRTGRTNRPCYSISVSDSRFKRDGRTVEDLGLYDPIASKKEKQIQFDVERAKAWIAKGAQPSDTVRSIFKRAGVFGEPGAAFNKAARDRSGRKKDTKTKARRAARDARIAAAKLARPKVVRKPKADEKKKKA
jgi:small subunit ribosomal protein S16